MYQVCTYEAAASVDALPINALAGYVGVLDVLELTPWNGLPLDNATHGWLDDDHRQLGIEYREVLRVRGDDVVITLPGTQRD